MRRWINSLSLGQRMSLPIMGFILLVFLSFQVITYQTFIKKERASLVSRIEILAQGVGMNLTAAILFDDRIAAQEILSSFKAEHSIALVELNDGKLLAQYSSQNVDYVAPTEQQRIITKQQGFHFGNSMLYLDVPIAYADKSEASLFIAVSLEQLHQLQITQLQYSLFLFLLYLVVCGYIVNRLQAWVTKPIAELNKAMRSIVNDDKKHQFTPKVTTNDELGELANCFNDMQVKLQERDVKIRTTLQQFSQEKVFAEEVVATVQHALLVIDESATITLANDACFDVLGVPQRSAVKQNFIQLLRPQQPERFKHQLTSVLSNKQHFNHYVVKCHSPQTQAERTLQIVSRPLYHQKKFLFAIEDITKQHLAQKQQRLAANVFDSSQDAIIVLSQSGIIEMVNPAFENLIGFEPNEVIGKHFHSLLDMASYRLIENHIRNHLNERNLWQGEYHQLRRDGSTIPLLLRVHRLTDPQSGESQVAIVASDLRSIKENERLERLATHDSLTNLPNRSKLHTQIQTLLTHQQQSKDIFAVLFIDLDGFKTINDNYGHDVGDSVLKIVAARMSRTIRQTDMVGRLSGDEFITVINHVADASKVEQTSERILHKLHQPISLDENIIEVGASIGCYYVHPGEYQNVDDILRRADKAMYEAKRTGKGKVVIFNPLATVSTIKTKQPR
ncbi:diguanylate cyclase domain-containing protein [Photobacterium swingsii]|uniref:diguanylate cyclase domain-containing protein n=1 Tax=Photobacterium swingsii TaxID=680026 RepID=UPI004068BE53